MHSALDWSQPPRYSPARRRYVVVCALLLALLPHMGRTAQLPPDSGKRLLTVSPDRQEITVYPVVSTKKHQSPAELLPAQLSVSDNGRPIDSELLRLSTQTSPNDHPILFLFDRLDPMHARNAAKMASKALKAIPDRTGSVAVWAINDRLRILQNYTQNRNLVSAAVSIIGAPGAVGNSVAAGIVPPAANATDPGAQALNAVSSESLFAARQLVSSQRIPWWTAAIEAAAQTLRTVPGRKAIVYFTQEAPSGMYATQVMNRLSQQLRDASVILFVVDVNEIDADTQNRAVAAMVMGMQSTSDHVNGMPTGLLMGQAQQTRMGDTIKGIELGDLDANKPLLRQVARDTSGGYTNGSEDLKRLMRDMVKDLAGYCELTYPVPPGPHEAFHSVVVRSHGFIWKGGYLAPTTASDAMEKLTQGSTDESLKLQSAMLRLNASPEGIRQIFAVEVPVRELELREDGNTKLFSLHASIAVEILDAQGKPVARAEQDFQRQCAKETEPLLLSEYLSLSRPVVLPVGGYSLHAVVRDWNSGATGTVTDAFTSAVPPGEHLLSDLVLVRSVRDQGGETGLSYGQDSVVPDISGVSADPSDKVSLYFQQYGASSPTGPPKLSLEVEKDGKLLQTIPLQIAAPPAGEASAQMMTVALSDGPGAYKFVLCMEQQGHTLRRILSVTAQEVPDQQARQRRLAGVAQPGRPSALERASAVGLQQASADVPGVSDADLTVNPPPQTLAGQMLKSAAAQPANSPLSAGRRLQMIEAARAHALTYSEELPDFLCLESLDRSVDRKDNGDWKHRDTILERLRYLAGAEKRTLLQVNGESTHMSADSIEGVHSVGEFGGILSSIFETGAQAQFQWVRSESDDGVLLQVFRYSVGRKHSEFSVSIPGEAQIQAAFDGLIYIDSDTLAVRRLVAVTRGLPGSFSVRSTWIALRYDYIDINDHEYLMPVSGEVGMIRRNRSLSLNELHFSDYRRFGSKVRILEADGPMTKR